MATYIDDQYIGYLPGYPTFQEYVTLNADVSRSGNTVTLSNITLRHRVTTATSGSGFYQNFNINHAGGVISSTGRIDMAWSGGLYDRTYNLANGSFNVGATDTSATLSLSDVSGNALSFVVSFPSGAVAPSGLGVTIKSISSTTVTITYSMNSWGIPASGRWRRWYGTTNPPTTNEATPDPNYAARTTFTETITGLTPLTRYYLRVLSGNPSLAGPEKTISFMTTRSYTLYAPVNSRSRGVYKLYASVEGKSAKLKKLYGSANGRSVKIFEV